MTQKENTLSLPTVAPNLRRSELYPGIAYDPNQGYFVRFNLALLNQRKIFPNEAGLISYACAFTKKAVKRKASVLAWEIFNNASLPENSMIYHKDMNTDNLKIQNLGLIEKEDYQKLKDSLANTNGGIRITPHKTNAFMYVIEFKHKGRVRKIVCQDILHAKRIERVVLLKSVKILSKYLVST